MATETYIRISIKPRVYAWPIIYTLSILGIQNAYFFSTPAWRCFLFKTTVIHES